MSPYLRDCIHHSSMVARRHTVLLLHRALHFYSNSRQFAQNAYDIVVGEVMRK